MLPDATPTAVPDPIIPVVVVEVSPVPPPTVADYNNLLARYITENDLAKTKLLQVTALAGPLKTAEDALAAIKLQLDTEEAKPANAQNPILIAALQGQYDTGVNNLCTQMAEYTNAFNDYKYAQATANEDYATLMKWKFMPKLFEHVEQDVPACTISYDSPYDIPTRS